MDSPTKTFQIDLGALDYIRVLIWIERGAVVRFTVQYEGVFGDGIRPIVRFDSAHGMPHRDTLGRDGGNIDKLWLPRMTNAEALTYAIRDIRANWLTYRAAFERINS